MYQPTTRVLTVLELLQSHRQLSGPDLAGRLEVDIRSVRRYIMMLQDLGIPVEAQRGRYGAYRLRPGYKLPPLMFNEEEALAVILGLAMARRLGLAESPLATEGALAKIERVLPVALRERVRAVQESLALALPGEAVSAASALVVAFSLAVQQSRCLWLRYRAWEDEETERVIDPYGLVHRAGRWYAAGYCHLRQAIRVFRLDRVLEAQLREETFTRPADFDPLAEVELSIARAPGEWSATILLKTTLEEARRLTNHHILAVLEETAEGVLMRCYAGSLEWLACFLATLPCPLVILEPSELRQRLGTLASRLATLAGQAVDEG
jgi:predicted DNA-binding transcriptional regulator YafY